MGTVQLLDAIRSVSGVKAVVNVTSDKCYANRDWFWGYRETDSQGGHDPYSSSKGCAELVTAAFRSSFFNPDRNREHGVALASVRSGNVVGGGDRALDRLVPDVVRAISRKHAVTIRNPDAIRPWQQVLVSLAGYLMLAQNMYLEGPAFAEAWIFGPDDGDDRTAAWIAQKIRNQWGQGAIRHETGCDPLYEAAYLKLDCSKAKALLGWRPRWTLERALDETVTWYKGHCAADDMRNTTLRQIQDYMAS